MNKSVEKVKEAGRILRSINRSDLNDHMNKERLLHSIELLQELTEEIKEIINS